jgi:hypothetical protein
MVDRINDIYKTQSSAIFRLRMVVFVATLLAAVEEFLLLSLSWMTLERVSCTV